MKYLILILLNSFLISNSFGEDFLLFPNKNKSVQLKEYLYKLQSQKKITSFARVFSEKELQNIHFNESVKNSYKIKVLNSNYNPNRDLDLDHLIFQLEENKLKKKFFGDLFSQRQWYLNNDGKDINIQITDIQDFNLQAKVHEDIQPKLNLEKPDNIIKIAVIDSGIDLNHPDLKNKVLKKEKECIDLEKYNLCLDKQSDKKVCDEKWRKIDNDNNGYPLDCHGWNITAPTNETTGVRGNANTQDLIGHGTHISGLIAAENNHFGITGVISNVKIIPVKVSGSDEELEDENATDIFAKGILYALNEGVKVINLSVGWASNEDSFLVTQMIEKANELGIIVIAAGGNSAHSSITYPCSYSEVICVGSHNPDGELSHFSNFGTSIDLLAPGRHILSTWPVDLRPKKFLIRHGYEYKDGTSFAAPIVAAMAARLFNLGFSSDEVRAKLLAGTRKKKLSHNHVLNGNADLSKSISQDIKSFIYPYKKTPALINWEKEDKKLIIKLKNYNKDAKNVKITLRPIDENLSVINKSINIDNWKNHEQKTFEFNIQSHANIDSDILFDLQIESDDENKVYPFQAQAISIIHKDFKRDDSQRIRVMSKVSIKNAIFKVFKNIDPYQVSEFLIVNQETKDTTVALMKFVKGRYIVTRAHALSEKDIYFSELARVDLDQDNKAEYVLIGHVKNTKNEWTTKFYVFDQNFRKTSLKIAPENTFDNKLTSLPPQIYWTKINNQIVPIWISKGYCPKEDLKPLSPWEKPELNEFQRRIYYFGKDRLHTIKLIEDEIEYLPHSFFSQLQNQDNIFKHDIIAMTKIGQFKNYYKVSNFDIGTKQKYEINEFVPFFEKTFLSNSNSSELFTNTTDLDDYSTRIDSFSSNNLSIVTDQYTYLDIFDPIQLVINKTHQAAFFALTKYNLLYLVNGHIFKTESRNTNYQQQYQAVRNKEAMYLPSQFTPDYTSEYIYFDHQSNKILRSPEYRFTVYGDCIEFGFISNRHTQEDKVAFYCEENHSLFLINL